MPQQQFRYVDYKWDDAVAGELDPVERLRYRSNIRGEDQRITNTGGGNTSSKILMADPLTAREVDVLWVKSKTTWWPCTRTPLAGKIWHPVRRR